MNVGTDQGFIGNLQQQVLRPQGKFNNADLPSRATEIGGGFSGSLADQVARGGKSEASKGVVGGLIDAVDSKQKAAMESRRAFLSGESNNLHQIMIASQESSVAFSLMVEMRNKVMEAYQELMRIQV